MDSQDRLFELLKKTPYEQMVRLFNEKQFIGGNFEQSVNEHKDFLNGHGWGYDEFIATVKEFIVKRTNIRDLV